MSIYETVYVPKVAAYNERLRASLKPEFSLKKLPPPDQLNVIDVPVKSGVLTEKEIVITETTATELVKKLAAGELTATETLTAFAKRATMAHQLVNCAMEFLLDEAFATAKQLDEEFAKTGKPVGPLHGLPISTKEHMAHAGRVTTAGFVAMIENITPEDAHIIATLKKAGAVFFVRTNEPQSLMHLDTQNNITGECLNAYNRLLSPGGSSGGEGAITGMKGSPLGIGSDIGGSIRGPAAFNGSYGLKPTSQRLSGLGGILPGEGQISIMCTFGPLGQSVDDLELFMKTYLDTEPWEEDVTIYPIPWRKTTIDPKKLRVGVIYSNGHVTPQPPIQRGLKVAVSKIEAAGIAVKEFKPTDVEELLSMLQLLFLMDGGKAASAVLAESGEPLLPLTQLYLSFAKDQTVAENWKLNDRRDQLRNKYQQLLKEYGVDVILCPAYGGTAPLNHTPVYVAYTALWNILDMPAVVIPTGLFSDPELDPVDESYEPMNEHDKREYERYVPEQLKGAPISLQIVGGRYKDEYVVAAASIIDGILKS